LGSIRNDGGRAILLDVGLKATPSNVNKQMSARSDDKKDVKTSNTLDKSLVTTAVQIGGKEDDFLDKQLQQVINGTCTKLAWRAIEVREHFRRLWKNEQHIIRYVYPMFDTLSKDMSPTECPMDVLFMDTILVPPSKFRPIRSFGAGKFESPLTVNYRLLMETDELLRLLYQSESRGGAIQKRVDVCFSIYLFNSICLGVD
jgi:DNA-directed RNA polymerase I subunit RPA1